MARVLVALSFLLAACAARPEPTRPTNVVVIFVDDMGYADIGPFGGKAPTPNLDRMAKEGMRFSDFHVSSAVCSASRAALLTGCYHARVSVHGAFGPDAKQGLHPDETTIAEVLREKGYRTACFGKWHLGHRREFLPLQQGFDEWFGLPYSNDMWPLHPAYADLPPAAKKRKEGYPDLPLYEGNEVVDAEITGDEQATLTRRYTERAVQFVAANKDRPFFLYLPHTMVHVPLFASPEFADSTRQGLYADVVAEIDWSVGQVLAALREHGLDEHTLVVFTSDNGPWLSYGDHAGSAGPFREGKGTAWEGGHRVPMLARWPGVVPATTTCDALAATVDLLPTFARLANAALPERAIDGVDLGPLLRGEVAASPRTSLWSWYDGQLRAVRDERFALVLPHAYATLGDRAGGTGGRPAEYRSARAELALYDLDADPSQTTDVAAAHPAVVQRLLAEAEAARAELGDRDPRDAKKTVAGRGVRPAGSATLPVQNGK